MVDGGRIGSYSCGGNSVNDGCSCSRIFIVATMLVHRGLTFYTLQWEQ